VNIAVKFLEPGAVGPYSGYVFTPSSDAWLLPRPVVACSSGYHFATIENLVNWARPEAYEIETRGAVGLGDKSAAESIRFVRQLHCDDRVLRHFAADCAEACLPLFERERPRDDRPRRAIEVARRFADGQATLGELAVAWAAAGAAARAQWAIGAPWDAAWAAAGAAARAPWAAARAPWAAAWGAAANRLLLAYLLDDDDARSDAMELLCQACSGGTP
jgi:hypothetical protein